MMLSNPPQPPAEHPPGKIELKLWLPLLWLAVLLLTAFILPDRIWNTLLVGFGGLFLVAWLWAWQLAHGLQATRQLRFGWVAVGDRLEETFTITNSSVLPALWAEVVDETTVPGYRAAVVRSVNGRQQDRWRETAVCQRRGQYNLGPWEIRSGDPFGIFQVTHTYPVSREIIIHPPVHGHLPIPLPAGQRSGRVRARQRAWRATINAAGVRDYRPGDPMRWIHWRSSAHRGDLVVREFDLDAAGDIWILLDLQADIQVGHGADGTEEQAVLLAASLAARAIRHNRAVGLATYGQQPHILAPTHGDGQRWNILRALALVQADGQATLTRAFDDLNRFVKRGTAVLLITPNPTLEWLPSLLNLAKRGIQSNIILLDRPSFGGDGNSSSQLDAIRQLGFNAFISQKGEVGQPLEVQERRGFWEFHVTATGRVIPLKTGD